MRLERRAVLVANITNALRTAVAGGDVHLRGSLATGHADQFSDIDLLWIVPNGRLPAAIAPVAEALATVSRVDAIRIDPELQRSSGRRLLFIRLANLPLSGASTSRRHSSCRSG